MQFNKLCVPNMGRWDRGCVTTRLSNDRCAIPLALLQTNRRIHICTAQAGRLLVFVCAKLCCSLWWERGYSGSISGSVRDSSGAYIGRCCHWIGSEAIGVNRSATTTKDGRLSSPTSGGLYRYVTAQVSDYRQDRSYFSAVGDRVSAGDLTSG